jgi:preprotein translocase subunit SecB
VIAVAAERAEEAAMASDSPLDEEQNAGNGGAGAQQPVAEDASPILQFRLQYIKDLSFENPHAPRIFESPEQPEVSINVNVGAERLGDKTFEIILKFNVTAKAKDDVVFIAELEYGGIADVENVAEQEVQPLVLIEGPRFLFPFARAILANVSRDGGFPPLLVGAVDFVQMYRDTLEQMQAQAQ